MVRSPKLNLVGRILLAMLVGVAAGFVLPDWGLRGLKTLEELVAVLLRFLVPLVILGLVSSAIVEAGRNSGKMLAATFVLVIVSVVMSGFFSLGVSCAVYQLMLL